MNDFAKSILQTPISVLGAGSWGTALAILLAKNGQPVRLWGHDPKLIRAMRHENTNERYLPKITFPQNLQLIEDLPAALYDVQDILIVVPSSAFPELIKRIKPHLLSDARIFWGTKGLAPKTGELLHVTAARLFGTQYPLGVLSGPSFAKEVAHQLPTAVTVATTDVLFAKSLTARFNNSYFRVYTSQDLAGVEVCGVVKNILAIAAGIISSLKLGANALSAMITRGLVEMQRLGIALGGKSATFTGLAGLGDLVLSCTDNQSRNRQFGRAIASGKTPEEAIQEIGQAVEGFNNLKEVYHLAQQLSIDMPITEQVYRVVYEKIPPRDAIHALFSRKTKEESE